MKLLLFSDLHCDIKAAQKLVERARTVDVLVGAGDFGNARRNVWVCVDVLRAAQRPAVLVAGNNESTEELAQTCKAWKDCHVLHGSGVEIGGVTFYGLPGGVPVTPFGSWSFDFSEEEAADLLRDCPPRAVLVSHSPPKGAVDVASAGASLGSTAVRQAVEEKKPLLVVCGHIHACAGQQAIIGETPVVNAGPVGVEWELRVPASA